MTQEHPTANRRQQAAQDKEQRIVKAALALFAQRGFHGTAVPEVAKAAGVGAGTIYRYFDNKEALVNAVFRSAKNKLRVYLLADLDLDAAPRALFHQFWQGLIRFTRENPTDFRFLELQDHVPYLDQESRTLELNVLAPIWAFCVDGSAKGTLKSLRAEALMAMIWGAYVGLMKAELLGYLTVTEATLEEAEALCWQMLAR